MLSNAPVYGVLTNLLRWATRATAITRLLNPISPKTGYRPTSIKQCLTLFI